MKLLELNQAFEEEELYKDGWKAYYNFRNGVVVHDPKYRYMHFSFGNGDGTPVFVTPNTDYPNEQKTLATSREVDQFLLSKGVPFDFATLLKLVPKN